MAFACHLAMASSAAAQRPAGSTRPATKGIWEPVNYSEGLKLNDAFFVTPDVGWETDMFKRTAQLAGVTTDDAGKPLPKQPLTLAVGGRVYRVTSDAHGDFRFRFQSIPRSEGTLTVGRMTLPVNLAGAPVTGLAVKAR